MFEPRRCAELSKILLTQGENVFMVYVVEKLERLSSAGRFLKRREKGQNFLEAVCGLTIICDTHGGLHSALGCLPC